MAKRHSAAGKQTRSTRQRPASVGPFTIGRVIHSSRCVGFTGWIGGVAVFDWALSAEELGKLAKLRETVSVAKAVR